MFEGGGKIVLTRPQPQADEFAELLYQNTVNKEKYINKTSNIDQFKGRNIVFSPVTEIVFQSPDLPSPDRIDAVILTSANALTSNVVVSGFQDKQFYVVGQATARKAQDLGFKQIEMIAPDVESLLVGLSDLIKGGPETRFLYLRGQDITTDIRRHFVGSDILEVITYAAIPVKALPEMLVTDIRQGNIAAVAFFSKRAAMIFCDLAKDFGLAEEMKGIKALCMSSAMLEYARSLFDGNVYVSETPDSGSMLNLVQDLIIKGIVGR